MKKFILTIFRVKLRNVTSLTSKQLKLFFFKSTNLLKIDFSFENYKHLEYNKNENMSIYHLNHYVVFFRYAWYRVISPFYTMTLHFFEVSTGGY